MRGDGDASGANSGPVHLSCAEAGRVWKDHTVLWFRGKVVSFNGANDAFEIHWTTVDQVSLCSLKGLPVRVLDASGAGSV
jgi:hypothetical protein